MEWTKVIDTNEKIGVSFISHLNHIELNMDSKGSKDCMLQSVSPDGVTWGNVHESKRSVIVLKGWNQFICPSGVMMRLYSKSNGHKVYARHIQTV